MCHVCQLIHPDVIDSSSKYTTPSVYISGAMYVRLKILRMPILEISTLVVVQLPRSFQCNLNSGSFFLSSYSSDSSYCS